MTAPNNASPSIQDALANICRKTGMSPAEILKAFDGLVLLGCADKRKVASLKKQLENIDPDRFH